MFWIEILKFQNKTQKSNNILHCDGASRFVGDRTNVDTMRKNKYAAINEMGINLVVCLQSYAGMNFYFNKQATEARERTKQNATFHKLWCGKCEMQRRRKKCARTQQYATVLCVLYYSKIRWQFFSFRLFHSYPQKGRRKRWKKDTGIINIHSELQRQKKQPQRNHNKSNQSRNKIAYIVSNNTPI